MLVFVLVTFISVSFVRLCFVVSCIFCVFFFKQKTAYEMRISDWSSDVCSSDLDCLSASSSAFSAARTPFMACSTSVLYPDALQIGRASCRERVCQYV